MNTMTRKAALALRTLPVVTLLLGGCVGLPDGIAPVTGFDAQRYLGTWYEIARLDHSFERGLQNVSASYSFRDDGSIRVINRGFNSAKGVSKDVEGTAKFVGPDDTGHLKVSFFGPFYSSYVVFSLDQEYQVAYVSGYNQNYLWLLARTPTVSAPEKARFVSAAKERGFDVSGLIWVSQDPAER